MTPDERRKAALALVERTTIARGRPGRITDPLVLSRVAATCRPDAVDRRKKAA